MPLSSNSLCMIPSHALHSSLFLSRASLPYSHRDSAPWYWRIRMYLQCLHVCLSRGISGVTCVAQNLKAVFSIVLPWLYAWLMIKSKWIWVVKAQRWDSKAFFWAKNCCSQQDGFGLAFYSHHKWFIISSYWKQVRSDLVLGTPHFSVCFHRVMFMLWCASSGLSSSALNLCISGWEHNAVPLQLGHSVSISTRRLFLSLGIEFL